MTRRAPHENSPPQEPQDDASTSTQPQDTQEPQESQEPQEPQDEASTSTQPPQATTSHEKTGSSNPPESPESPTAPLSPRSFFSWRLLLFYGFAAYFTAFEKIKFLSMLSAVRMDWARHWEAWHAMHMANKADGPYQYRALTYLLANLLHQLGLPAFYAYISIRVMATFATCLLLHWLWRRWLSQQECIAGVITFLLCTTMSLLPLIQPAEPLNVLFFVACSLCLAQKRWGLLYLLALAGGFNKLTLVFLAPLVFFAVWLDSPQTKTSARLLASLKHALIFFLCVLSARLLLVSLLGYHSYGKVTFWRYSENLNWLQTNPAGWNFIWIAVLPTLLIWASWRYQPSLLRAHSLMMPFFIIGHFLITVVAEVRTFVVTLILSIPAILLWLRTPSPEEQPTLASETPTEQNF